METSISHIQTDKKNVLRDMMVARSALETEAPESLDLSNDDQAKLIGQSYYRLAKVYYDKSDLEKAEKYFLQALEMSQLPRDTFAIFKTYGFLIRIYSQQMRERDCEKYINLSEQMLDQYSEEVTSLNAEFCYSMGVLHSYKADFLQAKKYFQLSYKKSQEENEPELVAKSLYSLGTTLYSLEDFKEALLFMSQLNELLQILKKDYLKGCMFILYGKLYTELGNFKEAHKSFDEAMRTLQKKSCWNLYSPILIGKGVAHKKMGEFDKALMYFDLAKNTIDHADYKKLSNQISREVEDVNDSSVDIYLDRHNRVIHEKNLGTIDFKHRFVLLEILFLLARNSGTHFSKEDLAKAIWKDEYNPLIHDKLIYTSVSRLRKLIEPKDGKRKYIVRGKDGYTFNSRVNYRFHKENELGTAKKIGDVELNQPV
jgi:tetratricopeptide (TPR) repeat protein